MANWLESSFGMKFDSGAVVHFPEYLLRTNKICWILSCKKNSSEKSRCVYNIQSKFERVNATFVQN